jgi:uncharacterized protein
MSRHVRDTAFRDQEVTLNAPVRMLVTGDSHFRSGPVCLPVTLKQRLSLADIVVHTGDFCTVASLTAFESYGDVLGVRGNNEDSRLNSELPDRFQVKIGPLAMLVTHGHLERGRSARDAVHRQYSGDFDIVVFGHSHQPVWEEVNGTWFLNPGSATAKRREPRFSFAMIEFTADSTFEVSFVYFDKE